MKPKAMPSAIEKVNGMAIAVITAGADFGDVVPFDLDEAARHQAGDVEQRRRRRVGRDGAGERRDEQREQEQHARR